MKSTKVIAFLIFTSSVISAPQNNIKCAKQYLETIKRQLVGVPFSQQISTVGNDVKFYLFSRNLMDGSVGYSIFEARNFKDIFSGFSSKKDTKIVIHGWLDNVNSSIITLFKEAYLPAYDYNLIIVDWSEVGSMDKLYPEARKRVPVVADQLAVFLDRLCNQYDLKLEDLHVIGHSLGAHIAGIAGHKVVSGKLGRVTGLDPAGPLFSVDKPEERISNVSALFVDIIHTCGLFLGTTFQMGHADFFPNKGHWIQPGCGLDIDGVCSHSRSYLYFIESIKDPNGFMSTPCTSWADYVSGKCKDQVAIHMGSHTRGNANGFYFLTTNSQSPFSQN